MIIDTSKTSDKVIQDLMKWEAQLMKQRKYINEKIDEIERIIKENYGGDGEYYSPDESEMKS